MKHFGVRSPFQGNLERPEMNTYQSRTTDTLLPDEESKSHEQLFWEKLHQDSSQGRPA